MTIDDDMLMAFVDGELDEVGRARVERAAAEDPEVRARLERQQRLRVTLAAFYRPVAEEEVPAHLRAMLETNVVALSPARPARPLWQSLTALAATLVLGLALGRSFLLPSAADGPVSMNGGLMVAQGPLAHALDGQLASAQPADAPTRIGLSFAANDGRLCRSFDSAALSGVACHGDQGWQLMMTSTGSGHTRTAYRQAGTENPLVAEAAQAMMTGEAMDAAAERSARDSGWRRR